MVWISHISEPEKGVGIAHLSASSPSPPLRRRPGGGGGGSRKSGAALIAPPPDHRRLAGPGDRILQDGHIRCARGSAGSRNDARLCSCTKPDTTRRRSGISDSAPACSEQDHHAGSGVILGRAKISR